jgi:hypothetical protein
MADTTSLRFLPLGQIHLAFGDVYITAGSGSHRLTLPIQVTGTWLDPDEVSSNAPTLLVGEVWIDQPNFRWLVGLQPQVLTVRGYQAPEDLVIDLSDDQLIALERARGENDLVLRLKLQATLLFANEAVHPVAQEDTQFRISRSRWSELLDQVGTEVGIVLRVPSPLVDSALQTPPRASAEDAASLSRATARLRQARAELRDHQWKHCAASCREVLENLDRLLTLPSGREVSNIKATDRTQAQRWAAIFYDVKSLANAAHHDDDTTVGFSWTRADAEAILAATAGLLTKYTASD